MLPRYAVWGATLLLAAGMARAQTYRIAAQSVQHRTELDVEAFAEASAPIHNPLRWPLIRYVIADGSWADEGMLVAAFDATDPSNELARTTRRQTTATAELARDMADIDNSERTLRDRLAEVLDQIAVLEARRTRLLAIPDPNEVAIAASRLRVAALAWAAASNEFAKAQTRFEDQLISLQEREAREADRDDALAELDHAATTLAITRRPTPLHELRPLELELDSARLERVKVEREIADNALLVAIRKRGAGVKLEQLKRQIAERESDLAAVNVTAPLSGHVMYMTDFRRNVLDGGDRMWKNHLFLRVPDPATLAFRGVIPEASRRFVSVGDPAALRLVGFRDQEIPATVASIGATARDTADRENQGWGESKRYGVKVYDVVLRPACREPWMRVGAHAAATLQAQRITTAPAVPLTFVRTVDGKPHLTFEDRNAPASGVVSGGWLLLDDPAWLGRTVALHTPPPRRETVATPVPNLTSNVLFTTTGELVPSTTTPVLVRRIHRWQKITWIIPEDTVVTQGMTVARIDDKETLEEVADWESQLTTHSTDRETQEQNNAILDREQSYQLAVASNTVESARIAYEAALAFTNDQGIADARWAAVKAGVRARAAERNLARLARLPPERVAAVERVAAERAVERAVLQQEAAELQWTTAKAGTAVLELERLRLAYEEAKLDLLSRATSAEAERVSAEAALLKARRREAHTQRNLSERKEMLANLELTAPCAGTVRYNRVWNNDSFSRVQVGSMVGSRFAPLQIVDVSRMEARAEVPETHFAEVFPGQPVEVRIPSMLDTPLTGTVRDVEYLLEQRRPKDAEKGLYSSHEALGETVFFIRVGIEAPPELELKPGAVATLVIRHAGGAHR